jgi:hypothetical protein
MWIKYVDLQKCYSVKLGEALPWCCVPLLRRTSVSVGWQDLEELRSNGRRLNRVPASSVRAHLTQEVWVFAHPSDYRQISA